MASKILTSLLNIFSPAQQSLGDLEVQMTGDQAEMRAQKEVFEELAARHGLRVLELDKSTFHVKGITRSFSEDAGKLPFNPEKIKIKLRLLV